jgi:RNA polymerase sigma factor (TIGR02999 family)
MRRILIEIAPRKRRREARVGRPEPDVLPDLAAPAGPGTAEDLLAIDEALEQLVAHDPRKAELVKLRFYAGLSVEDAARSLGISRATADRDWAYARAWLASRLQGRPADPGTTTPPLS